MTHTLSLPHGTLSWHDTGAHPDALPVLLLHGFPHDRELWSAQIAALPDTLAGLRLLVPDLPGFGASEPLPESSMDGYADAVAALLDAAGVERAVIGGLSMGGYVALAFWRRHPSRVLALLLLDTKAGADGDAAKLKRRELITTVEAQGVGAIADGLIPGQLGPKTRATNPALVAQVTAMLHRAPAGGVIGAAHAMMTRVDSTPTLATITVPTLVLVGEDDTLTPPADAVALSSGIAGSRLVTVAGAGHLSALEQPAVVNAAIAEFLDVAVR